MPDINRWEAIEKAAHQYVDSVLERLPAERAKRIVNDPKFSALQKALKS